MLPSGCEPSCHGCHHRELSVGESAERKQRYLAETLAPWAERLRPLAQPAARLGYRDKVSLSAAWDEAWRFGLVRDEEVIGIPTCPVHSARVNALADLLREHLPEAERFPLAYLITAGAQATLVLRTKRVPHLGWLDAAETELLDAGVEGLWLMLNPSAGKQMFIKRGWELIWGVERSVDASGLLHGPSAFRQLQPELHAATLGAASAHLAPTAEDLVVDLYCGIGASLARWGEARTVGVEASGEAVGCARINAPRAQLLQGYCAERLPQLDEALAAATGRRLLYANPPRSGLEPEVLGWVGATMRPERMVYLSCSAGTLARDLSQLEAQGYTVSELQPYDFFPLTHHVEVQAQLTIAP